MGEGVMEDIVFQFFTIGLVLLFVISFALFVRRLLVNSTVKDNQLMNKVTPVRWNQMFLALIAYGVSLIVKLQMNSQKTAWDFFRILQTYLYKSISSFKKGLGTRKKRKSKGRQKVPIPSSGTLLFGNVALVKERLIRIIKRREEMKTN